MMLWADVTVSVHERSACGFAVSDCHCFCAVANWSVFIAQNDHTEHQKGILVWNILCGTPGNNVSMESLFGFPRQNIHIEYGHGMSACLLRADGFMQTK